MFLARFASRRPPCLRSYSGESDAKKYRVLVSGAGLTGLSTALRLANDLEIQPDIIEARDEDFVDRCYQNFGSLLLPQAAESLMQVPAMARKFEEIAQPIHGGVVTNPSGAMMGEVDFQKASASCSLQHAKCAYGVHWPKLHSSLKSAIKETSGADVHHGTVVEFLVARAPEGRMHEMPARAFFAPFRREKKGDDGAKSPAMFKESDFYDLVIAAEGPSSTIRDDLSGPHNRVRFYPGSFELLHTVIPRPSSVDAHTMVDAWGRGIRLACVPLPEDRLYIQAAVPDGMNSAEIPIVDRNEMFAEVFKEFKGNGLEDIVDVVSQRVEVDEDNCLKSGVVLNHTSASACKMPGLAQSCVLFMGDTGRMVMPVSWMGEVLAVEDAKALSECIRETTNPMDAVELFDSIRIGRAHNALSSSFTHQSFVYAHGLKGWLRDVYLKNFGGRKIFQEALEQSIRDSDLTTPTS